MKEYSTRDLPLIAYLALKGIQYNRFDITNGVVHFIYDYSDHLDHFTKLYGAGRGVVEPLEFFHILRKYRKKIFEIKENNV